MAQRPFRVLAVSSDRELLRSISRFLEVFGFQIETVADAALAKIVLSGQRPDFLIIDEAFEDGAL